MEVKLTPEERDELVHIIERYRSELRVEVRRTGSSRLKDNLKREYEVVNDVMGRLETQQ